MAVGDTVISVSVVLQLRAHRYLDARTNLDMVRVYLENDVQIDELEGCEPACNLVVTQ